MVDRFIAPVGDAAIARASLSTRHGTLDYSRRTLVMGILNVTPDSFYDGGRREDPGQAIAAGLAMVNCGADILDLGGESTRPGAQPVSADEELARVLPVLRGLRREMTIPISIDTYKSTVAQTALDAGADIVNDISALRFDPAMIALVARERVPLVLMHMQGTPRTMQTEPRYGDVVVEVRDFLAAQARQAIAGGVSPSDLIIDPGIGFGKNLEHNLQLLRNISALTALGYPVLLGASRKAFVGRILNAATADRLEGSVAVAVAAVLGGATLVRVHDVKETVRATRIADALRYGFPAC